MSPQAHPPLSVVVITHNNEETLSRCLESVRWAAEVIVVDRGSEDATLSIAQGFTEQVFYHDSQSLPVVQQFALSMGKHEWVLLLEPYEWVEEMLKHEVDGLLSSPDRQRDGYFVPTKLFFQGEWLRYGRQFPHYQLRLFKRQNAEISTHVYHQAVQVAGKLGYLENSLGAEPYNTVEALFQSANAQSGRAAYAAFERGGQQRFETSAVNMLFRPLLVLLNRLVIQKGLMDGTKGVTLAVAEAYLCFLKYAKLRHHLLEPTT